MKRAFVILIFLLSACTATTTLPTPEPYPFDAPQVLTPESDSEFVSSEITLSWDWSELGDNQLFVLRLWYGDETPQEVWTRDKQINSQSLIDAYSRDVGEYFWQVAVINANEDGSFNSMGSEWSPLQTLYRVRRLSLESLPVENQSDTAKLVTEQGFDTSFERIQFLQNWIHENTYIGEELLIYEADYSDASQMMFNHAQGLSDAPQMYCNGMSTVMLTTLHELGIESRLIFLYGEVPGWISQHTFLEVFNPDTQLWEVHDSTNNLYFIDTETGEIADTRRMVFGNIDTIAGCTYDGDCQIEHFTDTIDQYMNAFRYGFTNEIWVNPDRLNISRRVTAFDNANFPEFMSNIVGVPTQDLIFRFENWSVPVAKTD